MGLRCFAFSAKERGSGRCGGFCSVQRWSNDEMRATDERKRERGGQTVGTERASKQRAGHLITERVLLHACHRLTGSPPFPVGLHVHKVVHPGHVGSAGVMC